MLAWDVELVRRGSAAGLWAVMEAVRVSGETLALQAMATEWNTGRFRRRRGSPPVIQRARTDPDARANFGDLGSPFRLLAPVVTAPYFHDRRLWFAVSCGRL